MARASQIYIVHPRGEPALILAAFTVKYESEIWAERNGGFKALERYRIRDAGNYNIDKPGQKFPCPWEAV